MYCVKYSGGLEEVNVFGIHKIAEKVYAHGNDCIQIECFHAVKKLIDYFAKKDPGNIGEEFGRTIKGLLSIYPDVILRVSREPSLLREVALHAENLCLPSSRYHVQALEAFQLLRFSEFPVDRFQMGVKKKLTKILSSKIPYEMDIDSVLPAATIFLVKVCDRGVSCKLTFWVSQVLHGLLERFGNQSRNHESFQSPDAKRVYAEILAHVPCSSFRNRSCCVGIATLVRSVFRHGDYWTKAIFMELDVFDKMLDLFKADHKESDRALLDTIRVLCTCQYRLYIDHVVDHNLILSVIPYVVKGFETDLHTSIRSRARDAVNAFLENATVEDMFRASEKGMVAYLIELLKSRNEQAVSDGLTWLDFLLGEMKKEFEAKLFSRFRALAIQSRGHVVLERLRDHKNIYIAAHSGKLRDSFGFRRRTPQTPNRSAALPGCSTI